MSAHHDPLVPFEIVVLADGDPRATRATVDSCRWAARIRILERGPALPVIAGAEPEACDWQDDEQARRATSEGPMPLLVVAAGERVEILDRGQLDAAVGGMTRSVATEVWTPAGWEIRLHSPGPHTAERIGSQGDHRLHSLAITGPATSPWRRPRSARIAQVPALAGVPFVIAAPPYSERSAGIVALHSLCDRLNRLGYAARLCPIGADFVTNPAWETPLLTLDDIETGIVVYPEIVHGNPLRGRRVVRWLLNRPGYITGGGMGQDSGDLQITYSSAIAPDLFALPLPVVDPDVFFPKDVPGEGALVWAGKHTARPEARSHIPPDAVEITRTWPERRTELAGLLRRAGVLYSLDSMTALNLEATLCGTPVVLFPDDTWDRATIERHDAGVAGIGWHGVDDLEATRAAAATAYDRYLEELAASDAAVHRFVGLCAEQFFGAAPDPVRSPSRTLVAGR